MPSSAANATYVVVRSRSSSTAPSGQGILGAHCGLNLANSELEQRIQRKLLACFLAPHLQMRALGGKLPRLLRPHQVAVCEWQLGHKIRKLSKRLSVGSPFLWSRCSVRGAPRHRSVPAQIAHIGRSTFSRSNLFFKLLPLLVELGTRFWARGVRRLLAKFALRASKCCRESCKRATSR